MSKLSDKLEDMYAQTEAAYKQGGEMAPHIEISRTKILGGIALLVLLALVLARVGQGTLGMVSMFFALVLSLLLVWKLSAKRKTSQ